MGEAKDDTEARRARLSVVITSYNYERYVGEAIESLLAQPDSIEIIVVDDCSTDGSRHVIGRYADRVAPVFQERNQGHGGGFNAGFARAGGDLVMFLDADDFLLPGASRIILDNYDPGVAIYHYRMRYADVAGRLSGLFPAPETPLADGDISAQLRAKGRYNGTITSGLVFSASALRNVMPMDAQAYRQGADGYLSCTAPLYGRSFASEAAISGYRLHDAQHSRFQRAYAKRARWRISHDQARYAAIREHSEKLGLPTAELFGDQDALNVRERLVSIVFEPDKHPIAEETAPSLIRTARRLAAGSGGGARRLAVWSWWTLLEAAPGPARRALLAQQIDPAARPSWLRAAAKLRRRLMGRTSATPQRRVSRA